MEEIQGVNIYSLKKEALYLYRISKSDLTGIAVIMIDKDGIVKKSPTIQEDFIEIDVDYLKKLEERFPEIEYVFIDNEYIDMIEKSYTYNWQWMKKYIKL